MLLLHSSSTTQRIMQSFPSPLISHPLNSHHLQAFHHYRLLRVVHELLEKNKYWPRRNTPLPMADNEDPLADPVAVIITLQQYQKKLSTEVELLRQDVATSKAFQAKYGVREEFLCARRGLTRAAVPSSAEHGWWASTCCMVPGRLQAGDSDYGRTLIMQASAWKESNEHLSKSLSARLNMLKVRGRACIVRADACRKLILGNFLPLTSLPYRKCNFNWI